MRHLKLALAAVLLAVVGMVAVAPMAQAGYPPFASSRYCRYHLPGWAAHSCVGESAYRWVFGLPSWVHLF